MAHHACLMAVMTLLPLVASCKTRHLGSVTSTGSAIPPAAISVLYPPPSDLRYFHAPKTFDPKKDYFSDTQAIQQELVPRFCAGLWPRLVATPQTVVEDRRFQEEPNLPAEARRILGQSCGSPDFGMIPLKDFERIVDLADGKLEPDGKVPPLFRFSFLSGHKQTRSDGTAALDTLDMAAPWRWHIVSFRYLPCAFEQQSQGNCLPELRVVAQPILAYGPIELALGAGLPDAASETKFPMSFDDSRVFSPAFADYAIHLFYRLTPSENDAVRQAIMRGIQISEDSSCRPDSRTLYPHRCLSLESVRNSDYPFTAEMKALLGSIKTPFYKTAVMVSRQNNVAWKFYPLKRDASGHLVRDIIPALDPESAHGLGPKAAASHRKEQVFSRGISPGFDGYGDAHVRANPRPKRSVDSLDLFLRTKSQFQVSLVYDRFWQSQRAGLDRYLTARGIRNTPAESLKRDDFLRSRAQAPGRPSDKSFTGADDLPEGFLDSSDFKMAVFWAAVEQPTNRYLKDGFALDPKKDAGLTAGCLDAACALDRILANRLQSVTDDARKSALTNLAKSAKTNLHSEGHAFTTDIRGLNNVPAETLGSRILSLAAVKDRIDDPVINSEFTVDCVSCHVSHFEEYNLEDDPLQTVEVSAGDLQANGMYMTNQFSYYRDIPIVSRRVQMETLDQLKRF
jgi:hypothetical protein